MKKIIKITFALTLCNFLDFPAFSQGSNGADVYKANCMKCHQADGGGVPFKSAPLDMFSMVGGDVGSLVSFVDKGTKDNLPGDYEDFMPSFKALSSEDLAAVLTYVRGNFGNEAEEVSAGDVNLFRSRNGGGKSQPEASNKIPESPNKINENPQENLEQIVVLAGKLPPSKSDQAYAISSISQKALDEIPSQRLDDKLRQVAGFTLFRRSSSRVAHPTTQGVTLRSLGPNGAGRTLLLLDGIPQNDPFGGWAYWSSFETDYLGQTDVIKGAGAGRWGSGALAGTLSLTSRPITQKGISAYSSFGSFNTLDAGARANFKGLKSSGFISAKYFDSEGYYIIGEDQRGVVDKKTSSDNLALNLGSDTEISDNVTLSLKAGFFKEHRVNGLSLSTNDTKSYNLSLSLNGYQGEDETSWQINSYYRDVDFKNSFASVGSDRATTRKVLDQFSVPGRGMGVNGLVRVPLSLGNTIEIGFDSRQMKGETNENFRNLGAGFTRLRTAGGQEALIGGYAEYINDYDPNITFTGGIRWDHWSTSNGQRVETNTEVGGIVRQDTIEDKSGSLFNARMGAGYHLNDVVTLKGSIYSGFRVPTINEFYRPFRVGNDITEANPNLEPEKLKGLDVGVIFDRGEAFYFSIGYFYNRLENGIGNVTLAFGPGFFPPTGFVPGGGSLRQRQNIDEIETQGLELFLKTQITSNLNFEGSVVNGTSKIVEFKSQSALEGMRLSQSPKTVATASLNYNVEKWSLRADLRHISRQFEDDLNKRVLPAFSVVNIGANYQLQDNVSAHFMIENLFDETFLTGVNGSGLRTLGQPFTWTLGLKANF